MKSRIPISWILILVGIATVVAAILLTSPLGPAVAPTSPEDVGLTPRQENYQNMLRVGSSAIYVEPQIVGATEVVVSLAVLEQSGFVVIHADDSGKPGRIIGVSAFLVDGGERIVVPVDEVLEEGKVYYAMLHQDADLNGVFDGESERPLTDAMNNVILMSFEATADAAPGEAILQF